MVIIVQGPPASGKTTIAKKISERFSLPHISRDNIQEWLSVADETKEEKIQKFCAEAGYSLAFDLAGELAKGKGSFIVEGCFNPHHAPARMKEKLSQGNHEVIEIFLTARNEQLVERYLARAGSEARHEAHGDESKRGDELASHLQQVTYKPMGIGSKIFEIDNSEDFESPTEKILSELEKHLL